MLKLLNLHQILLKSHKAIQVFRLKIAQSNPSFSAAKIASLARSTGINIGNSIVSQILKQYKKNAVTSPATTPVSAPIKNVTQPVKAPISATEAGLGGRHQVLNYVRNMGNLNMGLMKLGYALDTLVRRGVMANIYDYNAIDFNQLGELMRGFTYTKTDIGLMKLGLEYMKNRGVTPSAPPTPVSNMKPSVAFHHGRGREINTRKGFQVNTPEEEAFPSWAKHLGDKGPTSPTPEDFETFPWLKKKIYRGF